MMQDAERCPDLLLDDRRRKELSENAQISCFVNRPYDIIPIKDVSVLKRKMVSAGGSKSNRNPCAARISARAASTAVFEPCFTRKRSTVRVRQSPPSSRTKKDIYAKNPEVSTASGFFCAQFLKSEKKISKRVLAKSVDLYLYPRHFEPLFRKFFEKAARFCSRQSVEFWLAFLLVLPNAHSKHRCRRVSPLCGISDVKTAGKPPIPLQDETTAYWRYWDARKQNTRCNAAGGRLSAGSQQSIGF